MPLIDTLKLWFERDVRLLTWREVEKLVDQLHVAEIRFSTDRFTYTITADTGHGESYLGCTCFERTRRRGLDLPDGALSVGTWSKIAEAIAANEITPVRSPPPPPGCLF